MQWRRRLKRRQRKKRWARAIERAIVHLRYLAVCDRPRAIELRRSADLLERSLRHPIEQFLQEMIDEMVTPMLVEIDLQTAARMRELLHLPPQTATEEWTISFH